jgi:uncharacterized membrane protein YhiD involved in acid resistance
MGAITVDGATKIIGAVTNAGLLSILLLLAIMFMLLQLFRRLDNRTEKVQDRVHNDYEALIVKVVEMEKKIDQLEASVKRIDEKLLLEDLRLTRK